MNRISHPTNQPTIDVDLAPADAARQVERNGAPGTGRGAAPPNSSFTTHRTDGDLVTLLNQIFRHGEVRDSDLARVTGLGFQNRISELAQDREAFHAFFQGHFGATDAGAVEKTRQQILDGTYRPPEVRFVGSDVLGQARGAYDAENDVIYLNRDLADPANGFEELARTFTEEMFEHFNHTLGDGGTAGDRGAKAMHALYGDPLSAEQIAALDAEDDSGTITVNGRNVAVEFDDGGGGGSDTDGTDGMDAEDVSAGPGDQQDGIGQSPGEEIAGAPGNDGGSASLQSTVSTVSSRAGVISGNIQNAVNQQMGGNLTPAQQEALSVMATAAAYAAAASTGGFSSSEFSDVVDAIAAEVEAVGANPNADIIDSLGDFLSGLDDDVAEGLTDAIEEAVENGTDVAVAIAKYLSVDDMMEALRARFETFRGSGGYFADGGEAARAEIEEVDAALRGATSVDELKAAAERFEKLWRQWRVQEETTDGESDG